MSAPYMDYSGNIFDAQGNYVRTDFYSSQQWKDGIAANDALQQAYAAHRAAEDAVDAGRMDQSVLDKISRQVAEAEKNYVVASGSRSHQQAAQAAQNAIVSANNAHSLAVSNGVTDSEIVKNGGQPGGVIPPPILPGGTHPLFLAVLAYAAWSALRDVLR